MAKDWMDAAIEFYDVMRRKTEEENARRGLVPCPHNFAGPDICPICQMHARLREEEYDARDDFAKSWAACLEAVRDRKANGGKGWEPK